jgi:hypothetical protein
MKEVTIHASVDATEAVAAIAKVEKLHKLLLEAKALSKELRKECKKLKVFVKF